MLKGEGGFLTRALTAHKRLQQGKGHESSRTRGWPVVDSIGEISCRKLPWVCLQAWFAHPTIVLPHADILLGACLVPC